MEEKKISDKNNSKYMRGFKPYIQQYWLIIATNNQLEERWVKDSKEHTHSGKDKLSSSIVAVCRSATVFLYTEGVKI